MSKQEHLNVVPGLREAHLKLCKPAATLSWQCRTIMQNHHPHKDVAMITNADSP